jgi:hypothetical protein
MMFKRLGIGSKILIAFLAIAIAAVGIIGIVSATLGDIGRGIVRETDRRPRNEGRPD